MVDINWVSMLRLLVTDGVAVYLSTYLSSCVLCVFMCVYVFLCVHMYTGACLHKFMCI